MKIAVLASNSFSGSSFISYVLESSDHEVIGISRSPEYNPILLPYLYKKQGRPTRFRFYQLDVNKDFEQVCTLLEKEKSIYREQLAGKPANIMEQIIEGKMQKFYSEVCLLNQPFIKNDKLTVDDILKEIIAKMGENIKIKRFARFEIGF